MVGAGSPGPAEVSSKQVAHPGPGASVDVARLLERGWAPSPFTSFILKIHSRCNLDCGYCYVYHMADQSWRSRPKCMALDTARQAAARIREHAIRHGLSSVSLSLHGGEPLLVGADHLGELCRLFRAGLGDVVDVRIGMQSNGVLLDETMADVLLEHGVRVGISLDGDRFTNDKRRPFRDGRSSFDAVVRALNLLGTPRYSAAFGGILCTIDLESDPLRTYGLLSSFNPPSIDFLLPHGNWTSAPPGMSPPFLSAPYAKWLIPIFDKWWSERPKRTSIRMFEEILHLLLGGRASLESVGLAPCTLVVIETDGQIEGVDTLKSTHSQACSTGYDVFGVDFETVLKSPSIVARQIGLDGVSEQCRACDLVQTCGGGYLPHRYKEGHGFSHPSVFCRDLENVIRHIRSCLAVGLRALRAEKALVGA